MNHGTRLSALKVSFHFPTILCLLERSVTSAKRCNGRRRFGPLFPVSLPIRPTSHPLLLAAVKADVRGREVEGVSASRRQPD